MGDNHFLKSLVLLALLLVGGAIFVASTESPAPSITEIVSEEQVAAVGVTVPTSESHSSIEELPATLSTLVGTRPVAVFLIEFKDSGPRPFTKEVARDMVFNSTINEFFKEQSYGRFALTGDVFDWFTVPKNFAEVFNPCSLPGIENASETADVAGNLARSYFAEYIKKNAIDFSKYDTALLLINHSSVRGGGGGKDDVKINGKVYQLAEVCAGLGSYDKPLLEGTPPSAFKWTNFDYVVTHEVSHSFGLPHETALYCGSGPIANDCINIDYGNPFGILGDGDLGHIAAHFKQQLGWLSPERVITIDKTGRYTLKGYEKGVSGNVGRIKLKNSDSFPYYLEYRTFEGFNSPYKSAGVKPGILINRAAIGNSSFTGLIRVGQTSSEVASKYSPAWFNSWTLKVGDGSFTDPETGVTIGPVISADADKVVFDVSIVESPCLRVAPKFSFLNPVTIIVEHGRYSHTIGAPLTNPDSFTCGDSAFKLVGRNSPIPLPSSITGNVPPKGLIQYGFTVDVSPNQPPGTYIVPFDIVNVQSGLKTPGEFTVQVNMVPKLFSISPVKGLAGTLVTATGEGFRTRNVVQVTGGGLVSIEATSVDGKTLSFKMPQIPSGSKTFPRDYSVTILPDGDEELATINKNFQVTGPAIACGDIDGNGEVTTLDILYIRRHILGQATFYDKPEFKRADINKNGEVTTLDIILIRQSILGQTKEPLQCAASI